MNDIGKSSTQRMNQSVRRLSNSNRTCIDSIFTLCSSDKSAFVLEHIKMMEAGFKQPDCVLLNKIYSLGRKIILLML